jgi:predicted O-linked N-acetylglucosamine transferase (SPINDLY family)
MAREDDWYKQAVKLHCKGDARGAFAQCQRILERRPGHFPALCLSGRLQAAHGGHGQALGFFRKALEIKPDQADLHYQAGLAAQGGGWVDDAVTHLTRATEIDPNLTDAWLKLGVSARENQRTAEAVRCLERVVAARPKDPAALAQLAEAYQVDGRCNDAVALFARALALAPGHSDLKYKRIAAQIDSGHADEAQAALSALIEAGDTQARRSLGKLLLAQYQYTAARRVLEAALAEIPDNHEARFSAAMACEGENDFAAAREHYAYIIQGASGSDLGRHAQNNRLFNTCYDPDLTPRQVYDAHQKWGQGVQAKVTPLAAAFANTPELERPIRVGYLSPDFRKHPVSAFIASMIAFHHPSQVVAHCYANVDKPDEVTHALKNVCPRWRDVSKLDDRAVARMIRADGIDILVDLAGLSGRNRVVVLAHRAAPLQVSYLGYPASTGLDRIDYRLTDAICNPPETQAFYSEKLVPVADGFCSYMPPPNAPDSGPLPALENGHITFGSLVNLKKVNRRTIALWATVLKAVPDSRLALIRHTLRPQANRAHYLSLFAEHGIGPERLDFIWRMPEQGGYLAHYQNIDVILDSLPFCGHTSTCEALWMGVPVLTLIGDDFAGRMDASVLNMAGLPDWVGTSPADFAERAARLTADHAALAALRTGLRQRLGQSRLLDGQGFTRNLEAAYRHMWQTWCAGDAGERS